MAEFISSLVIPSVFLLSVILFLNPKKDVFSAFIRGAKEGIHTCVGLIPTMVLLCAALSLFRASSCADMLCSLLSPIGDFLKIPSGIFPLIIMRPLSGAASNAALSSIATEFGADSFEAFSSAVIMGSSDTLIYVICVYFSVCRSKKTLYAFPCALLVMIFSLFVSLCVSRMFYGA